MTVKELKEQLERLEALGLGNAVVWFRDNNDMDSKIEQGVIDNDEDKHVVLG